MCFRMDPQPQTSAAMRPSSDGVSSQNRAPNSAHHFIEALAAQDKKVPVPTSASFAAKTYDHYWAIAEAIPHIVFTAEPNGDVDYYNQRWYDYSGLTPEDIQAHGARPVLHPEDYDLFQQRWNNAIASGEIYEIEYRLRRSTDGMYRWHLGRALPVRDPEGRIIKWFGTATDIHEQKITEEALRLLNEELEERVMDRTSALNALNEALRKEIQEKQKVEEKQRASFNRLENIMRHLPIAALAVDEHFSVLHTNEKFCKLFRIPLSPSAVSGHKAKEVFEWCKKSFAQADQYDEWITLLFASKKSLMNGEFVFKDGRTVSSDFIAVFEGTTYHGHLLLFRDVTQEKRIDAAKTEFMSLASHQLRTPLTAIRWSLGRLTKEIGSSTVSPATVSLLETSKNATKHMAQTIDTMLAISRIEAGKIKIDMAPVELDPLIQEVQEENMIQYQKHSQAFHISDNTSVSLMTDRNLLKEILQNLIGNAIKYTPAGGRIDLRVSRHATRVDIAVSDTGYGIPESQKEKIFSKFFRADNILALNTDGSGLGLYLTYRLVGMLGGTISFVSEEGKGTTFTVSFPILAQTAEAPLP